MINFAIILIINSMIIYSKLFEKLYFYIIIYLF